jgi:SpoVK/Ycf46/Vps4 family AAA+-type ATPase
MSQREAIKRIFMAQAKGDYNAMRDAAEAYIALERQKSHHAIATDLEKILFSVNGSSGQVRDLWSVTARTTTEAPKDKERGLLLVELRDPERNLDDLVLWDSTRRLLDRVLEENRRSEVLRSMGLNPARKLLFWGPPGCGKTVAAEAIAKALYLPLCVVRFDAVISSYLGETSANLRKVFDYARHRPMVLLFDEFDAIGKMRADRDEHGELKRVVNAFLQMMDGFRSETVMIAATNHEGLLDPALWRRFDEVIQFPLPDRAHIAELIVRNLRQVRISRNIRPSSIATNLDGMSHADVERTIVNSVKASILADTAEISDAMLKQEIAKQQHRKADNGVTLHRRTARTDRRPVKKGNASRSRR